MLNFLFNCIVLKCSWIVSIFLFLKKRKPIQKKETKVSSKVLHEIYLKFIEVTKILELAVYLKISVFFLIISSFPLATLHFLHPQQCFKLHIKYCKFTVGNHGEITNELMRRKEWRYTYNNTVSCTIITRKRERTCVNINLSSDVQSLFK